MCVCVGGGPISDFKPKIESAQGICWGDKIEAPVPPNVLICY